MPGGEGGEIGCGNEFPQSVFSIMNKAVINIQDPVGKTVGRRVYRDAMRLQDSTKQIAREWHRAFPASMPPRGVYRFKSHEEAETWLIKNSRTMMPAI